MGSLIGWDTFPEKRKTQREMRVSHRRPMALICQDQGHQSRRVFGEDASGTSVPPACQAVAYGPVLFGAFPYIRWQGKWRTRYDSNVRPLPSEGRRRQAIPIVSSCTYILLKSGRAATVPKRLDFSLVAGGEKMRVPLRQHDARPAALPFQRKQIPVHGVVP
jgi:hypothetical protein